MTGHAPFIVGAYLVALVGFGGLVVASWLARRKAKRALAERGLDRR
jgi:heme exporter protein CcmD